MEALKSVEARDTAPDSGGVRRSKAQLAEELNFLRCVSSYSGPDRQYIRAKVEEYVVEYLRTDEKFHSLVLSDPSIIDGIDWLFF
ncbi:hypothetical protein Lfu02_79100 [Longispora fulva]|nr:hypothetical protein Lfu02_79100 [Longispora fulva]